MNLICNAQVAEYGEAAEMVGLIKACVRVVSRGGGKKQKPPSSSPKQQPPAYVKVACLLGLRVSPSHRYGGATSLLLFSFFNFHMRMDACTQHNASISLLGTNVLSLLA